MANQKCLDLSVKILKVFAYLFTFVIVLGGGVISKGCVLFMSSQLRRDRKLPYCNKDLVSRTHCSLSFTYSIAEILPNANVENCRDEINRLCRYYQRRSELHGCGHCL